MLNEGYGGEHNPPEYFRAGRPSSPVKRMRKRCQASSAHWGRRHHVGVGLPAPRAMIDFPNGLDILTSVGGVTPDFMKQLLWDNPAKCFNLKV